LESRLTHLHRGAFDIFLACHLQDHVTLSHFDAGNSTTLGTTENLMKMLSFVALAFMA
jgi:hypothetical protein